MVQEGRRTRSYARYAWWAGSGVVGTSIVVLAFLAWQTTGHEPAVASEKTAPATVSLQARNSSPARSHTPAEPAAATATAEPTEPAMRGPSAGVWKVLGEPHANAGDEREQLIDALRAAPPCTERWCTNGRATLDAWVAAVSAKANGLSAERVTCTAAGCWTAVTFSNPSSWPDAMTALRNATLDHGWAGPSIRGAPDLQKQPGTAIALWAVLPFDETDESITAKGDQE